MARTNNGNQIAAEIISFYESLAADTNHRFRSWEHCFGHFRNRQKLATEEALDTACLHLAFYLASWGMYRGSSALLWKDNKIHSLAIERLLDPKYKPLWDLQIDDPVQDEATAGLIISLSNELKKVYREQITSVNGEKRNHRDSETLISKILLGTVGCTPGSFVLSS